jgi:putative ABC transport system permease protein
VLGHGLRLTAIGLAVGLFGALAFTPFLQNLPVAVRPPDVATITPVVVVIAIVAVAACLVPARRAARSSPSAMLRHD